MSDSYSGLDATSQADLARRKQVSPRELVDAAIARIEKLNPELNAVIIPPGSTRRVRSPNRPAFPTDRSAACPSC